MRERAGLNFRGWQSPRQHKIGGRGAASRGDGDRNDDDDDDELRGKGKAPPKRKLDDGGRREKGDGGGGSGDDRGGGGDGGGGDGGSGSGGGDASGSAISQAPSLGVQREANERCGGELGTSEDSMVCPIPTPRKRRAIDLPSPSPQQLPPLPPWASSATRSATGTIFFNFTNTFDFLSPSRRLGVGSPSRRLGVGAATPFIHDRDAEFTGKDFGDSLLGASGGGGGGDWSLRDGCECSRSAESEPAGSSTSATGRGFSGDAYKALGGRAGNAGGGGGSVEGGSRGGLPSPVRVLPLTPSPLSLDRPQDRLLGLCW